MNDDVYKKQEADELTKRIANRLSERQLKIEKMEKWERKSRPSHLIPICLTTAIAACMAALLLFSPFRGNEMSPLDELGISQPALTEYRAATPEMNEIAKLIEDEEYETALIKTEQALKRSDNNLEELGEMIAMWEDDEGIRYDEELEWAVNTELRWTYIFLLVKQGYNKEAKKQIKQYLKYPNYCDHEAEARALLEKIDRKK